MRTGAAFWFWAASVRILRGNGAVFLDALLYLGMGNGEHAIHEGRERVVFFRHGESISRRMAFFLHSESVSPRRNFAFQFNRVVHVFQIFWGVDAQIAVWSPQKLL